MLLENLINYHENLIMKGKYLHPGSKEFSDNTKKIKSLESKIDNTLGLPKG